MLILQLTSMSSLVVDDIVAVREIHDLCECLEVSLRVGVAMTAYQQYTIVSLTRRTRPASGRLAHERVLQRGAMLLTPKISIDILIRFSVSPHTLWMNGRSSSKDHPGVCQSLKSDAAALLYI